MKNRGCNDDRCVRQWDGREREKKGITVHSRCVIGPGWTDLHQRNHGYTSYGWSLYTHTYRYIDGPRLSLTLSLSLSVFGFTLRRKSISRGGARAKITDGKLGIRLVRRRIPGICQGRKNVQARTKAGWKIKKISNTTRCCRGQGEKSREGMQRERRKLEV